MDPLDVLAGLIVGAVGVLAGILIGELVTLGAFYGIGWGERLGRALRRKKRD